MSGLDKREVEKFRDYLANKDKMDPIERVKYEGFSDDEIPLVLSNRIKSLQSSLDKAVEALEFYGKNNSWRNHNEISESDLSDLNGFIGVHVGGKRARQALTEIKGKA